MSNADAQKYFAKCEELAEKLEAAHVLRNPHDTDVVYFLAEGETVEVYWEAGGEPDGFVAPAPQVVPTQKAA
jgi:hypothetical protein